MSNLSEYEKKRLENIRANEALLRGLELPTKPIKNEGEKKKLKTTLNKPKPKQKPRVRPVATRASARIRGQEPDLTVVHEDMSMSEPSAAKRARFDDSTMSKEDEQKFLGVLEEALKMPNTIPAVKKEHQPKQVKSYQTLQKSLQKLEIRHEWDTVKVTNSRITTSVFHPSQSKILACAADKEGYVGFWDVNGTQDNGDPVTYKYKAHKRTVNDMHFNPADNSKLLSAAYDGLIQVFDMNAAKFEALKVGDIYSYTGFDMTRDGHCVWFTTSDGELGFVDMRSKKDATIHQLKAKKIGCVHLNPVQTHLMALSSNDRSSTIWDLRMWSKSSKDDVEPLQSIEHGYSVTSSYWSPNGDMLATTAYDNFVRLFDLNSKTSSLELNTAIRHNCTTGR
ncbi:hypothetical protein [Parasitella parasitica]|uniref:DNA damage-binding protein CMR1 n=1 Tax=Parasitella parasitica TaxID=35722 RepID=A0A0B7NJL4_9FUNG|nr:hypothetical protein [Parasitella parasitica]